MGCEQIYAGDMTTSGSFLQSDIDQLINEIMIDRILDILEKHYHGRNWIDRRCAEELLTLIENERHGA